MQRATQLLMVVSTLIAMHLFGATSVSLAQRPTRYSPSRPTVSPYLNLFRPREVGSVPNYFSLVRPQLQQNEINQLNQQVLQRQTQAIQQLQTNVLNPQSQAQGPLVAPTGKSSWFAQPAKRSTFMSTSPTGNASRFYSRAGGARPR
jgi:hypothetical protein